MKSGRTRLGSLPALLTGLNVRMGEYWVDEDEGVGYLPVWNNKHQLVGFTEVDADVVESLARYHWTAGSGMRHPYVRAIVDDEQTYLHKLISGVMDGVVDHLDGNALNNRRANLHRADADDNFWKNGDGMYRDDGTEIRHYMKPRRAER